MVQGLGLDRHMEVSSGRVRSTLHKVITIVTIFPASMHEPPEGGYRPTFLYLSYQALVKGLERSCRNRVLFGVR